MTRQHKGSDGWGRDSFAIPQYAVMGSSNTGMWEDSPCPSDKVKEELDAFCEVLDKEDIEHRYEATETGNIFNTKVWIVVPRKEYTKAQELAIAYLEKHKGDTRYIHDAKE